MEQFKCSDCNSVFNGDELNYQCPHCQSENTNSIHNNRNFLNRVVSGLSDKKIYIYVFILLALVFAVISARRIGPDTDPTLEFNYKILIDSTENEYNIKIIANSINFSNSENTPSIKPKIISIKNAENSNHALKFERSTGKLFLCPSDSVDIIEVIFQHNDQQHRLKEKVVFNLKHSFIVNNKDCPIIIESKDFEIEKPSNKDCSTKINISIYGEIKGLLEKDYKVSVDGKNGEYFKLTERIEYEKMRGIYNIFFFNTITEDTIEYIYNGNPFPKCTPKNWEQIEKDIEIVFNKYLRDPIQRENSHRIRELNNAYSLEIILENEKISFNHFENQIPVEFENRNQIKYKLKSLKINESKIILHIVKI